MAHRSTHPARPSPPATLRCFSTGRTRARRGGGALFALAGALAVTVLSAAPAAAQGTEYSAVVGATFSTLRGVDGLESRSGSLGGLRIVRPLGWTVALQPEFLLVNRGAGATSDFFEGEGLDFDAVEIPLALRFSLAPRGTFIPHFYAGPYLGFTVRCTVEGTSTDCDERPGISTRTVDVGGVAGSGLGVAAGPLILSGGLRYGFGVSSLAEFDLDDAREEARHGAWSLYLTGGFRFGGGG